MGVPQRRLQALVTELLLRLGQVPFARHVRADAVADAVPGDLAVLLVDPGLLAEVAEQVVQVCRIVRVTLPV